jgi:hypothetical protein
MPALRLTSTIAHAEEPLEEQSELGQHLLPFLTVTPSCEQQDTGGSSFVIAMPVVLGSLSRDGTSDVQSGRSLQGTPRHWRAFAG